MSTPEQAPQVEPGPAVVPHPLWWLALGAIGVVYGDIGTSPLYAVRECFAGGAGLAPTPANVLGVISLVIWSLVVVVSVKYLLYVLRADNRGEGGILALLALLPQRRTASGGRRLLFACGLFGAALLYGDAILTPAISVLSAVEGFAVATPALEPFVVPLAVAVLVVLFAVQRRGTAGIGSVFGPVMLLWFLTLAVLGVAELLHGAAILAAFNPLYGVGFLIAAPQRGFLTLGAVFLVVTGGEALYADMGHFGRRPIRGAWFAVVLPALLLNYLGQGALLLREPQAAAQPFFRLAPSWALFPLVLLATAATIIASQAVISGVFSLTRQAVQLGYVPRLAIVHTSAREIGQVYLPVLNAGLLLATVATVLAFGSSSALAAAYGVAVSTTMAITTLLAHTVARELWRWRWLTAALVTGTFLLIDLAFTGANLVKINDGGWFPLAVAGLAFLLMTTWKRGRQELQASQDAGDYALDRFLAEEPLKKLQRVPGTAVYMASSPGFVPRALLHNLKHNWVLHRQVVLLTVTSEEVPAVEPAARAAVTELGNDFFQITLSYGFMEPRDVPRALAELARRHPELRLDPGKVTYFLARVHLIPRRRGRSRWRKHLFAFLYRNAGAAANFFRLPANRVVELGSQLEI